MIFETYILEVKMRRKSIKTFPYAKWNYNTKQIEIYNQERDCVRSIPFEEIKWFRKK
jgi:hypothetical protein